MAWWRLGAEALWRGRVDPGVWGEQGVRVPTAPALEVASGTGLGAGWGFGLGPASGVGATVEVGFEFPVLAGNSTRTRTPGEPYLRRHVAMGPPI